MRLGQLARKNDIPVQELIDYLDDHELVNTDSISANTRLDEDTLDIIYEHYMLKSEEAEELAHSPEIKENEQKQSEASVTQDIEVLKTEPDNTDAAYEEEERQLDELTQDELSEEEFPENTDADTEKPDEEESEIQTDEFINLLESEDQNIDLSRYTKIKAPKKKLEGIKVVGKIELPDPPKPKTRNEEVQKDSLKSSQRRNKNGGPRKILSEEEKEKRRLNAKMKRDKARQKEEERRKKAEKERLKERRRLHYQKTILEKVETEPKKKKSKEKSTSNNRQDSKPTPKTLLGKFWRWFTTY